MTYESHMSKLRQFDLHVTEKREQIPLIHIDTTRTDWSKRSERVPLLIFSLRWAVSSRSDMHTSDV